MRVISGKYRGKKLVEFDLNTTKPTLDRVKESIFNLIQFDIADAVVCDLFSGTGAFGIECLSRGAKFVDFVDSNTQAIKIIKTNLAKVTEAYAISNVDYESFLQSTKKQYDLFLLDPPYKTDFGIKAIKYILEHNLLKPKGKIIFETLRELEFDFSSINKKITRYNYGTVSVYKLEDK